MQYLDYPTRLYRAKKQKFNRAGKIFLISALILTMTLISIYGVSVYQIGRIIQEVNAESLSDNDDPSGIQPVVLTGVNPPETIITPKPTIEVQKDKRPLRKAKIASSVPIIDIQRQVQSIASEYGWGHGEQWDALSWIIQKESSWNPKAQNPKSTAFGLFQFLDMTRASYNCPKTADVDVQTRCGLRYVQARYGDPIKAKAFHLKNNWY